MERAKMRNLKGAICKYFGLKHSNELKIATESEEIVCHYVKNTYTQCCPDIY